MDKGGLIHDLISIKYTLTYADNMWSLQTPKTKTSERYVTMSTYTKELLLRHRKEQDKLKAVVGVRGYILTLSLHLRSAITTAGALPTSS